MRKWIHQQKYVDLNGCVQSTAVGRQKLSLVIFLPLVCQRYQYLPIKLVISRHFCRRSRALLTMVTVFMTSQKWRILCMHWRQQRNITALSTLNLVVAEQYLRNIVHVTSTCTTIYNFFPYFYLCWCLGTLFGMWLPSIAPKTFWIWKFSPIFCLCCRLFIRP